MQLVAETDAKVIESDAEKKSRTSNERALNEAVIKLDHIHKIYKMGDIEVHALRGISLTIHQGEFVAVMGVSGSGKSTMMNIIGCLDQPTRGTYILDDRDVSKLSKDDRADIRNQKIGFVFQGFNLLSRTSAIENVEMPMLYAGIVAAERRRRAQEALESVGLAGRETNHPTIILADEPTGALDSRTSVEVMEIFQRLNRERGLTLLIVTHEHDIAEYAKRVIIFRDGKIRSDEPVLHQRDAAEELKTLPVLDDDDDDD